MSKSLRDEPDWRLKLRYGRVECDYSHYTLVVEGRLLEARPAINCPAGPAFMGVKVWASSEDNAFAMTYAIARHEGFEVTGRAQLYETEPDEPPEEEPFAYGVQFTPFSE